MALAPAGRAAILAYLNRRAASLPAPGTLKSFLQDAHLESLSKGRVHHCGVKEAALFFSASIELWHRAIHSLISSVALSADSPIWAASSAYYSSHYVMRSLCSAEGWVCKKNPSMVLSLEFRGPNRFEVSRKPGQAKEHIFYWQKAAELFPEQEPILDKENRDQAQRNGVQYWDHIGGFRLARFPIVEERIRDSLDRLAASSPSELPEFTGRPAIIPLQANALHRITFARDCFARMWGDTSRYWSTNKEPGWARALLRYPVPVEELENAKSRGSI